MSLSRRSILTGAAVTATAGAAAAATAIRPNRPLLTQAPVVPLRSGQHQAGITTAQQDRLMFAAFDVVAGQGSGKLQNNLRTMLAAWTAAAEQMTAGLQVTAHAPGAADDAPADTGETIGDSTGRLTITIGYGPTLFSKIGLAAPGLLEQLPAFPTDNLDPTISGGDIAVQACADDPEVAFHAIRNLTRIGHGTVATRWTQSGFGRTSSTSAAQDTPRNLMGFKDGTRNVRSDEHQTLDRYVWAEPDTAAPWVDSYLVSRRIRMRLEKWDGDGLDDQQQTFGRYKRTGASFGRTGEFDPPDFTAMPPTAHVRLAAPENNGGLHILRRGYSFADGIVNTHGQFDAGLFFLAYMADPAQFVHLQTKLSAHDDLGNYITHVSSGLFAVPRGLVDGEDWGTQLYDTKAVL